ncbi:MAG: hypothetical protein KAI79_11745, partial [Bacteroidales bacterium]|nr:hypothetical protein [Bacteroidales bacterium]
MKFIDPGTILILQLLSSFFIAVFLFVYTYLYKKSIISTNIYILGKLLQAIAIFLFMINSQMNSYTSIVLASLAYFLGFSFEAYALLSANNSFNKKRFIALNIIAIFFTIIIVFLLLFDYGNSEIVITSALFMSGLFLYTAFVLIFSKQKTKMQRVTGYLAIIISFTWIIRFFFSVLFKDKAIIESEHSIQLSTYIVLFTVSNLFPLLYLLILKERDEERFNYL